MGQAILPCPAHAHARARDVQEMRSEVEGAWLPEVQNKTQVQNEQKTWHAQCRQAQEHNARGAQAVQMRAKGGQAGGWDVGKVSLGPHRCGEAHLGATTRLGTQAKASSMVRRHPTTDLHKVNGMFDRPHTLCCHGCWAPAPHSPCQWTDPALAGHPPGCVCRLHGASCLS